MKKYIFIFLITLVSLPIFAQKISDFDKYKLQKQADYNKFKTDREKAFANYIKKNWAEFELFKGKKISDTPKPTKTPTLEQEQEQEPIILPYITPEPIDEPSPVDLPKMKTFKVSNPQYVLDVDFYGINLPMNLKTKFVLPEYNTSQGKKSIAKFWNDMSNTNVTVLISEIANYKEEFQLNDYAVYLLAKNIANSFTNSTANQKNLATWYFMNKLGYLCRVGTDANNDISLLLAINTNIYNTSYISVGNRKYYYMDNNSTGRISTYNKDFSENGIAVNLHSKNGLNLPQDEMFNRTLALHYKKDYSFSISLNKTLIKLYSDFPQCDISVHFNEPLPVSVKENLYPQLELALRGMSQSEKAEFLLRFTQTVFEYQTDGEQFNKENYLFFAETLFYPYSDCEDRSVFYAHLVRDLLDIEVLGLNYPGHISTAIEDIMGNNSQNSFFNYSNKRFIIADPTYINAKVGMCMPQYINTKAKIILVK